MSIAFYLTRSVRTQEHYLVFLECLEAINKSYPNVPIIVIRDNEHFNFAEYNINENDPQCYKDIVKNNIYFIDSEFQGVAETLRLYYYWKVCTDRDKYSHIPATHYAICMHDSMFIHTQIILDHCNKYGYEDFFTARQSWNIPEDEKAIIDIIPKNRELLHETYKTDNWHTNFGVNVVLTFEFLNKVNKMFDVFNPEFLSQIHTHEQRVALERIWGLMFACCNYNPNTVYGDINTYHGWQVQRFKMNKDFYYKFYVEHKEYYVNFPIIKVWCNR